MVSQSSDDGFMSKRAGKFSPYRCGFCRNRLSALPFAGLDWVWMLTFTRPYQCPHCFSIYKRPFAWIGRIPGVVWLTSLIAGDPAKPAGMLNPSDAPMAGPAARGIAKMGKWVQNVEKAIARICMPVLNLVWAIVWLIPGLLLGGKSRKKKKSRSRGKFLK